MTLNVTISVPQGQSFGAKVEVIDQVMTGDGGEDGKYTYEYRVAQTQELQPGECFQPYLTSSRSFKVTEIPLKKKE